MIAKWSTRRNRQQLIDRLDEHLNSLMKHYDSIQYPGIEHDLLFPPSYTHTHRSLPEVCSECRKDLETCNKDCDALGCDTEYLITRTRTFGIKPRIHFGRFGSANMVLKSGLRRDSISKDGEIVGFEMEGSGVWEALPTIIIKSVCDYADSHKNKLWQEYAAATAAAGLKAVLEKLELQDVGFIGNYELPLRSLNIKSPQPRLQDDEDSQQKRRLSKRDEECLQAFYSQPSYRDTKDRIPKRVQGTCNWFLAQKAYQDWSVQPGGVLLVSADPGCGKSVLSKHLIDFELPSSIKDAFVCYFFFKDQIQNTLALALCAILHQVFSIENDLLIKHAVPEFQNVRRSLMTNVSTLFDILT